MRQFSAIAASIANSTALRSSTGSAPGMPRHTGQTLVFGGEPNRVEHEKKIFAAVSSWTCTSKPMTGSYLAAAATEASKEVDISDQVIIKPVRILVTAQLWGSTVPTLKGVILTAAAFQAEGRACAERSRRALSGTSAAASPQGISHPAELHRSGYDATRRGRRFIVHPNPR